jgi:hypothetical protein
VLPGIQEKNINAISVKVAEKVVKEQNRSSRIEHTSECSSRVARRSLTQ